MDHSSACVTIAFVVAAAPRLAHIAPRKREVFREWEPKRSRATANDRFKAAVPTQNLKPDILMMEPAEDWLRCDAADLLRPPKIRSIFIQ